MSEDTSKPQTNRRRRPPPLETNTIRVASYNVEPERTGQLFDREDRPAPVAPAHAPSSSAKTAAASSHAGAGFESVPETVLDHYYRIGPKYYLDNGELAFENRGDALTTKSENTQIVRDLLAIAQHNGHRNLTVAGTERFRREVWGQALRLGIEIQGYQPTEHDEKQWVRKLAREDADRRTLDGPSEAREEGAATTPTPDLVPGPEPALSRPRAGGPRPRASVVHNGELLDHGRDHYQHNPREAQSYYVALETRNGPVELWGVDLERALTESKSAPQRGDQVTVRQTGQRPVTVSAARFDEAGKFIGQEDKPARRNEWTVEKTTFVAERAELATVVRDSRISAQQAGDRYPQLVGTYFLLKEAQEFAKAHYKTPAERESFAQFIRERLADEIERGEPLRTTQIRERNRQTAASRRDPPTQSRDPVPALG